MGFMCIFIIEKMMESLSILERAESIALLIAAIEVRTGSELFLSMGYV